MARRLPLSLPWIALAVLLAAGSLLAWRIDPTALDWQGLRDPGWPWRAFTAAFVHWTPRHLYANLAGCAVLAALGWAARLPARCALAWLLAWPLSILALLARPELIAFGGASGVLHAGVAVAAVELMLMRGPGRERWIGIAIAVGLTLKVSGEDPLGPVMQRAEGWGEMPVVTLSHLTGAVIGAVLAAIASGAARYHRRR
ncbi:rhombosortase [Pelomonas sp. KK5]|uniref:rhombosortase n=1 Tax=Pelomonas sp. KK5 TaxID=1855730 RepID=UPI00097C2B89|nr:rhombosortase [Pelomonas sp. KK5]